MKSDYYRTTVDLPPTTSGVLELLDSHLKALRRQTLCILVAILLKKLPLLYSNTLRITYLTLKIKSNWYTIFMDIFRINDDLCYLRMLLPFCNGKLSTIVKAANKLIDGLALSLFPQAVIDGSTATSIYTDIIKYLCTMINGNNVSKDAFLN